MSICFKKGLVAVLLLAVTACTLDHRMTAYLDITLKDTKEAVDLLNSGQVSKIGTSASGWTLLTLLDGRTAGNKGDVIGNATVLLEQCVNCSETSFWIE